MKVIDTLLACILASCFQTTFAEKAPLQIYTNSWPPYINTENQPAGRAAQLIDLVAAEQGRNLSWRYLPYDLSFTLISRAGNEDPAMLGFPYFKTPKRQQQVLYSTPVLTATNRLYVNRQFMTTWQLDNPQLGSFRIGQVSGYSYGEKLDQHIIKARVFSSEIEALNALFANQIDVLPMSEEVMADTLQNHFPNRSQLIIALPNYSDTSTLHVIASNNKAGKKALNNIDQSLQRLRALNIAGLDDTPISRPKPADVAQLITVEGYPSILGQTLKNSEQAQFYSLPQGTQVIVIQWSEHLLRASYSDRLYKTMMGLSHVVILNGPHTGKELFVRNMHIKLL